MEESNKKKLTYEELGRLTQQYVDKCNELTKQLNEANYSNFFLRLDYLFKVIQNSKKFNAEFVIKCTEEIEEMMTIKPSESNENS